MTKIPKFEALTWVTQTTRSNPDGLTTALAENFGVSRAAAATFIKKCVETGFLLRSGSSTRPSYALSEKRQILKKYPLSGIDEATIWEKDFVPYLDLPENIRNICQFGFTEMVNNAIDHSEGKTLLLSVTRTKASITIIVVDDGVGIFKKISSALKLSDMKLSFLELTKGKFTTDKKNHSGEGIFFTSRAFDIFVLGANGLIFNHFGPTQKDKLHEFDHPTSGTVVTLAISLKSNRVLREVFDTYTSDIEELTFDKTIIPVRLARLGSENLVSRSQAKRLLQRIDKFRFVEFDFSDVKEIGQAFADEVFRVFANQHPEIKLEATHTTPDVKRMINRAIKTER